MDELTVALLAIGAALAIVVIVGLVVWCRRTCKLRGEYVRLDENDYDFDVPPNEQFRSAANERGSVNLSASKDNRRAHAPSILTSTKMWVGGANPTDVREPAKTDPINYAALARREDERAERNSAFLLSCANASRSLPHQRTVHTPLPNIGHREFTKYYALVSDAFINRTEKRTVAALLSLNTVTLPAAGAAAAPAIPIVNHLDRALTQARIRSLLLSLQHPNVLPTLGVDISVAYNSNASVLPSATSAGASAASATAAAAPGGGGERYNVFVVREYSDAGSLRDYIHDTQPALLYRLKYCHPTPDARTLTYPPKDTRPARMKYISRYGRHILLGCQYLRSLGYPMHGLHSGNVILKAGVAVLTDYENSLLGVPHRFQSVLRQLVRTCAVSNLDPLIASFGALMYELASGAELNPNALATDGDTGTRWVFGLHAEYQSIDAVLQLIFNGVVVSSASGKDSKTTETAAAGPTTIDTLLDLPVFGGGELKLNSNLNAAVDPTSPDRVIMSDPKTTKLLSPLCKFYASQFSDARPASRSTGSGSAKSKSTAAAAPATNGSVAIDIRPAAAAPKRSSATAAGALSKSAPAASASKQRN